MEENTRRNFIRKMAFTGASALVLPETDIYSSEGSHKLRHFARNGSVILFQGDSITDGNHGRTTDPNHIMGHGYAFSLASRLGADYAEKSLVFYNRGISGNKINDLANRWQTDTIDLKPDLLSILVGVNDTASVVFQREPIITAEKYEEIYKSLLDMTLKRFPDVLLVLCEPFILEVGKVKDNWVTYQPEMKKRQEAVARLACTGEVHPAGCRKGTSEQSLAYPRPIQEPPIPSYLPIGVVFGQVLQPEMRLKVPKGRVWPGVVQVMIQLRVA